MSLSDDAIGLAREAVDDAALGRWWEEPGKPADFTRELPENQSMVLLLAEIAVRLERLDDRLHNVEKALDSG